MCINYLTFILAEFGPGSLDSGTDVMIFKKNILEFYNGVFGSKQS
jgi:hypothetical protein